MPRYELAGRTIALTGSTGGLGSALAQALRARGANLALMDLDRKAAEAQAARVGGGSLARAYAVDVRDLPALEHAMQAAADDFGRLDVAVANAGVEVMSPMALMDPEEWERTVDINLNGVWRTYRAALPHVAKTRGYLLGISSMAAFVHSPLQAPYTSSKAGVWAMSNSVRLEVRHLGVDVGTIHPTFFRTPMMDRVLEDAAGRMLWGGHERVPWKIGRARHRRRRGRGRHRATGANDRHPQGQHRHRPRPGRFRPFVDRFGWRKDQIPRAIDLVARRDDR